MNEGGARSFPTNRSASDEELRRATPPTAGGREVQVGVFILLGVLGVLAVLFLLTDPATFRGRYLLVTEVADAGGVRRGDPVQMRGVNIGRVRRFDLVDDRVAMSLEIDGRWRIPADSHARITGLGLLGGRTVEIVPGRSTETLPEGGVIPGESVDDFGDIAATIGMEVDEILEGLRTLVADTTVDAIHGSAVGARALVRDLSGAIEEQRVELERLTSSLRRSAEAVEEPLTGPDLARALARADTTMARLQVAGASLERTAQSLEAVLGGLERGEGTLGRLAHDEELYVNLNRAAEALGLLAEDVRLNPGRYLRIRIF